MSNERQGQASTPLAVTKDNLKNRSFQEILYRIHNWINERCGWIVELIESHTLTFQLLDHCQEVFMCNYLFNYEAQKKD